MAGTTPTEKQGQNQGPSPIEAVNMVRAAGSGMLAPPWGRNDQTVVADPASGRHVLLDWRKRAVVFELRVGDEVTARTYVPFERIDQVVAVIDD